MAVSQENRQRYRAVLISRAARDVLMARPERFARALLGRWLLGALARWLFLGPDGKPHRAGEIVLAELRDFCHARPPLSPFDTNALLLARRVGRREVFDRLTWLLHLDEAAMQAMMQVDDGLGD